jgi:hypothetical protein
MDLQVKIRRGAYRGKIIEGTYPLFKPFTNGARGGYVTIKAQVDHVFCTVTPRIMVNEGDFVLVDQEGNELTENHQATVGYQGKLVATTNYEETFAVNETDDEAMERIRHTFAMLDRVTDQVAEGKIRGLIVTGPPGIGKSFGVEKVLKGANLFRITRGDDPKYEIISGAASSIGLYKKLYYNREKGQVAVFDDSDSILFDEESLNLLKNALGKERRRLSWNKESKVLLSDDIPSAFDFEGGIIFLTNIDFINGVRAGRIAEHLKALVSRCHYMDLEISTTRDKLLRIRQIVGDGMLDEFNFRNGEIETILQYIHDNAEFLRELSLRMVTKIAELVDSLPNEWREFAEATVLVKEAKFQRLLAEKRKKEATAAAEAEVVEVCEKPTEAVA